MSRPFLLNSFCFSGTGHYLGNYLKDFACFFWKNIKNIKSFRLTVQKRKKLNGKIPHKWRTECANKKICQKKCSNLNFGKEGNISRDWMTILVEYKKGRNMQNFQIFTERRRIGTNFIFQGFHYERCNILLHLIHFNWMAIASFKKNWLSANFVFGPSLTSFFAQLVLRAWE